MTEATCHSCGEQFAPARKDSRFCGKTCGARWYRNHITEPCSEDGCTNRRYSRGMCTTHYNRTRPGRHRKVEYPCCVCGTTVLRRVDKAREGSHCCSVECRRHRQFGSRVGAGPAYSWNQDAKARARKLGATVVEDVDRDAVLERDDWHCYLCDRDTRDVESPFDPRSATVDHVVPLTKGGEHSMSNVRCCCLACNTSKANREGVGPQPLAPAA